MRGIVVSSKEGDPFTCIVKLDGPENVVEQPITCLVVEQSNDDDSEVSAALEAQPSTEVFKRFCESLQGARSDVKFQSKHSAVGGFTDPPADPIETFTMQPCTGCPACLFALLEQNVNAIQRSNPLLKRWLALPHLAKSPGLPLAPEEFTLRFEVTVVGHDCKRCQFEHVLSCIASPHLLTASPHRIRSPHLVLVWQVGTPVTCNMGSGFKPGVVAKRFYGSNGEEKTWPAGFWQPYQVWGEEWGWGGEEGG